MVSHQGRLDPLDRPDANTVKLGQLDNPDAASAQVRPDGFRTSVEGLRRVLP
jgi:hypothetical protein